MLWRVCALRPSAAACASSRPRFWSNAGRSWSRCHRRLQKPKISARGICQKPPSLDDGFDLALVVPVARTAEAIGEQIVAQQSRERPRPRARAIAADLGHGQPRVVVQDRLRYAPEERERRDMTVEECLRRLGRIRLHERRVRMRQVHVEPVHLLAHAANHADGLAEVDLGVTRRVGERHERLAGSELLLMHVVLHRRVAAAVAVLRLQPLEDTLGRMALLRRRLLVLRQDRFDHANERPERWSFDRLAALITGWRRKPAHLAARLARQTENPCRLTLAMPFNENEPPHRCVVVHSLALPRGCVGRPVHSSIIPQTAGVSLLAHHCGQSASAWRTKQQSALLNNSFSMPDNRKFMPFN